MGKYDIIMLLGDDIMSPWSDEQLDELVEETK
jgi:hypothetical protein